MKEYFFTLILIFCFQITVKAQTYSKEFGKIGQAEFDLATYAKDKSAEAVVFFDIGKSYFISGDNGFDVYFERSTRIKILSEAGIKWAEVGIPFYQEGSIFERVLEIEAYTYNFENGRLIKTPLNVANCHDEKVNEYWYVKKFAMPEVKAGSIIEYRYKISSQYVFNLRDWVFQWKIPNIYSEYEVRMIPFYEYSFLLQGANKFDSQTSYVDRGMSHQFGSTSYQDMISNYVMKDIPAFNDEEFISSVDDYIIKIDFQLCKIKYPNGGQKDILTTWPGLIDDLIKNIDFGKYIAKCEKLAPKLLAQDNLAGKTPKEKFDFIISYVKNNYNWNKYNGKFASKSPSNLINDKVGNCADLNLFTVGLLNAFGIEAYPVIVSTRENGKIKYDYPYNHFFNYVLISANIDGAWILSDATEILNSNDRIPPRCINDKGLIIKEDKVEWVGLQCTAPSVSQTDLLIDFAGLDLNARAVISATEYDALYFRNNYGEDKTKIKEMLSEKDYEPGDSSIIIENHLKVKDPYILKFETSFKTEKINDKIYFSPFLKEPIANNPLKQNTRSYSIDMTYPVKRVFNSTINIPEGYKVDFVPEDFKVINNLFELVYSVKIEENKIVISFYYFFKNSVYSATDYSKIKYYFNEIVKKGNEKVVLTKV